MLINISFNSNVLFIDLLENSFSDEFYTMFVYNLSQNTISCESLSERFAKELLEMLGSKYSQTVKDFYKAENLTLDDIAKALQGGSFIEGNLELKVLSNKKLKLDDTILKRKN